MKKFIIIPLLFFSTLSYSQSVSCSELMSYVKSEGYVQNTLHSYTLNSSWLTKVTAYKVDGKIVVIAEIKREGEYMSKEYVFCGISDSQWSNFNSSWSGTYGERFNEYLMNSLCDYY